MEIYRREALPGNELAREAVEVKDGRFQYCFELFPDSVPPASYVARVYFDVGSQERVAVVKELKARGLDKEFQWQKPISVGSSDEQTDGFRASSRRLEGHIDALVGAMEGFLALMTNPSADWESSFQAARQKIAEEN